MNCPNCKTPIGENELSCPNCKKVLRLKCPNCGNVTKNTSCEKCGTVLLNKCYKCGKVNSTNLEKCSNCGMDINASVGLRESVIEEFAVLTIEITNLEDVKTAFKSDKITENFKSNLYEMIKNLARQKKLRVQLLENTFIIRFCKDYSFGESCKSALDFSIYVAQSITEINQKLFDAKGIAIKTQMVIQKRDVYAKPNEYKAGLNINVVYSSSGRSQLFNDVETAVDSYVYQETKNDYPYLSLSAVMLDNKMVMFFELVLQKIIKIKQEVEDENLNAISLPKNVDYEPEEDDEESLINFVSLHCTFANIKNEKLVDELAKINEKSPNNPIIAVCSDDRNGRLSLVSDEDLQKAFPETSVIRFSCPEKCKYSPFGLFKEIIFAYRNIPEIEFLLHPEYIDAITQEPALRGLFLMESDGHSHPEDLRFTYFEDLEHFIRSISYKTLFVIEDFDNADESSIEILKYLVENKLLGNVGFLISCDEKYALHRKIYKLMTSDNYYELQIKPTSNKKVVAHNLKNIKGIEKSFFIEKVLGNTKGSLFYFNQALSFLVTENVFECKENKYSINQDRMIVIPNKISELISKRIVGLQRNKNAFALYTSMLLTTQKMNVDTIRMFEVSNCVNALQYLEEEKFVTIKNDKEVWINNYNLYRKTFIELGEKDIVKQMAEYALEKVFQYVQAPHYTKGELLEICGLKKEAFSQWHSIAMVSSQLGDFCSYLNSTNKFLSLVDSVVGAQTDASVEKIKMDVYTELASLLYKYYPDKIMNFLKMILKKLEEQQDEQGIKEVANKLVQSCIISGNYLHALEYIGKIISRTPQSSFNPSDRNFNLNYFLIHLVTIEIYFNLGRLNECIELVDELFKNIDVSTISETILPEGFSKKQFNDAIFDALFFANFSRVIQLAPNARENLEILIQKFPQATSFKLLLLLSEMMKGQDVVGAMTQVAKEGLNDKYAPILFPLMQGIVSLVYRDFNSAANYVYNAKVQADSVNFHQMTLMCELLIGFSYQNLGNFKKAKQIYLSIVDESSDKGLKNITYIAWLLNANLEKITDRQDLSFNILNNAFILLEKDENASPYILAFYKTAYAEIMLQQGKMEEAMFCAEQVFDISLKNGLMFTLPKVADILTFIYNQVISSAKSENTKNTFKTKLLNMQNILSKLMQQK